MLGAGANGAAVAADLVRAGRDVTVIDPWPANVEAMRTNGITVRSVDGEQVTRVPALHVCEVATLRATFDLVVLGLKAYDTRWGAELIRPVLAADGLVVGMQNGMTVDAVGRAVGPERSVGCVIEVAAEMFTPAVVRQQAPMWLALGATADGPVHRIAEVVDVLAAAGTATRSDDILSAKWSKLVANAAELVTSAVLGLPLAAAITVPGMRELMRAAGAEAARTAVAGGRRLVPIFGVTVADTASPEEYADALLEGVLTSYTLEDTLTTVLQDWRKGRRAEIEEINGHVVRHREALGGEAPVNATILGVARRIEQGQLEARPSNVDLLTAASR